MTDTEKLLAEAHERLKEEWFSNGWKACLQAINKGLATPAMPDGMEVPGASPRVPNQNATGKEPRQGTTPHAILMAVRRAPGLTGGQIVEAVKASGHSAPDGSIKTNIQRLKDRRLIFLRHSKWYDH
jgi:hypothetical protein